MKKNLRIIVMLLAVILVLNVQAQQRLNMELGYSINHPGGSLKDEVSKTSFRGFTGGISYHVTERLGIGLGVSYSDFYEKYPRQVYQIPGGAVSAVISNSIQVLPIVAKAKYHFGNAGTVRPYVAAGAGMNLVNYDQFYGEFPSSRTAIKPALTGEAGINIPLGYSKQSGLSFGAHYNYLPFNYEGIKNLNSVGAHVSIFFPLK
jgi:opacity protein-like surface antigen